MSKSRFGTFEAQKAPEHMLNTSPTFEGTVQVYDAADWTGQGRWKDEDVWIADVPPDVLSPLLDYEFAANGRNWRKSFPVTSEVRDAIRRANVGKKGLFR